MRRGKSQLLPDFFGIQCNGWLQRICLLPQQPFHYRWENNSHSNRINPQLVQTTLVPLNLQTDLTTTSNFKVTDMHCGHRICLSSVPAVKSFWILPFSGSKIFWLPRNTCWQSGNPIKIWHCRSCRGMSSVLLFYSISNLWPFKIQENITKKWTFLIYCKWHETLRPTQAPLPIAGGTRLCDHTHGQLLAGSLQRFLSVPEGEDNVWEWHSPNLPTTQMCSSVWGWHVVPEIIPQ